MGRTEEGRAGGGRRGPERALPSRAWPRPPPGGPTWLLFPSPHTWTGPQQAGGLAGAPCLWESSCLHS